LREVLLLSDEEPYDGRNNPAPSSGADHADRPPSPESEQASAPHPAVGGRTWSADLELGAEVHKLLGDYLPRIAASASGERIQRLVELAGKLYDLHALKRIDLVRPGHVQDACDFDTEHPIRAVLAVWQPLENSQLDDDERQAINRALAGSQSLWMGEALRKVNSAKTDPGDTNRDHRSVLLNPVQARAWSEITICFLSDERVQVTIGSQTGTINYAEMGFASKKNGTPVKAWGTLRVLAQRNGRIALAADSQQWAVLEKRVQEIRKKFKAYFRLTEDPISFIQKTPKTRNTFGYRSEFNISCHNSFDS
jgi:hypothetical protein